MLIYDKRPTYNILVDPTTKKFFIKKDGKLSEAYDTPSEAERSVKC